MYILRNIAEEFIKEFHRNLTQGYNRATVLVARLQEEYIIYRIWGIAKKITSECLDCQRNKSARHRLYKMLQPVETPSRPQEVISQDFIIKLPKSKDPVTGQEYNNILVIVDKATKWGYFILYIEEISAEDLSEVYIREVFV